MIELPLHPMRDSSNGTLVWETAAELDSLQLYALMMGGPENPLVQAIIGDTLNVALLTPLFATNPAHRWNWHYVEVANRVGSSAAPVERSGVGGWQRLTVD